jgi:hypothetical protein
MIVVTKDTTYEELLESGEYFTIEQLRQKLEDNVLKQ